jgi:hypothetical protein
MNFQLWSILSLSNYITQDNQDVIKFTMLKYAPRALVQTTEGKFGDLRKEEQLRNTIGTVILPIPNGII